MRTSAPMIALAALSMLLAWHAPAVAQEQVAVAVMEFTSKGGVDQDQMDALGDMMANEIRNMGPYRVIGKSDIRAALQLEQQRSLLGCDGTSCIAEVGGALGVRWVVLGNISLFGKTYLMNLKMMDAANVTVASSVSRTVKGEQDKLIELLPDAVRALFKGARKKIWPSGGPKVVRPQPAGGEWNSKPASTPKPEPAAKAAEPVPPAPEPEPPQGEAPGEEPKPPVLTPPDADNPWRAVPVEEDAKGEEG